MLTWLSLVYIWERNKVDTYMKIYKVDNQMLLFVHIWHVNLKRIE